MHTFATTGANVWIGQIGISCASESDAAVTAPAIHSFSPPASAVSAATSATITRTSSPARIGAPLSA